MGDDNSTLKTGVLENSLARSVSLPDSSTRLLRRGQGAEPAHVRTPRRIPSFVIPRYSSQRFRERPI